MSSAAGNDVGKASGGSTKPPESDVAALKRLLERTPNVRTSPSSATPKELCDAKLPTFVRRVRLVCPAARDHSLEFEQTALLPVGATVRDLIRLVHKFYSDPFSEDEVAVLRQAFFTADDRKVPDTNIGKALGLVHRVPLTCEFELSDAATIELLRRYNLSSDGSRFERGMRLFRAVTQGEDFPVDTFFEKNSDLLHEPGTNKLLWVCRFSWTQDQIEEQIVLQGLRATDYPTIGAMYEALAHLFESGVAPIYPDVPERATCLRNEVMGDLVRFEGLLFESITDDGVVVLQLVLGS